MKVPFIDLQSHHAPIREEIRNAFEEVMDSGDFSGGRFVERFESDFAAYCGTDHAVGVGSGTDALWLTLLAMGVGPGDEVITVPLSFIATAESISMTGATPVFVDVDEVSYTMDPQALGNAINSRTKAIIPVHLFGHPAEMEAIKKCGREFGIPVIEDASQAHGAEYHGQKTGSLGNAGCFSFYPGKNLGAFGEAGAVVTNDREVAVKLRALRDHGQSVKHDHSIIGWNSRMDGIQGAILRVKLRHLDRGNGLRRDHAASYHCAFNGCDNMVTPTEKSGSKHAYHVYAIRVEDRDKLARDLAREEIGYGLHYPTPIHFQKAYSNLGYRKGDFPVSEQCSDRLISLPIFPEMKSCQIEMVAEAVSESIRSSRGGRIQKSRDVVNSNLA